MIEQALYFALGCVVTALAALAFAPLFWRRALRLTRRRLQLQVPLSMQEILAERDQLRAEFAVERLKIEQAMDRVRASKTRDMAVIGRQRIAATALSDEIAELKRVGRGQDREMARLSDELAAVQAEAGAVQIELHDAHALVGRWRAQAARDAEARAALRAELEEKRATIAALDARIATFDARLESAETTGGTREAELRGRLEAAVAQAARHEASGLSLRRDLDEARQRLRTLERELESAGHDARERLQNANLLQSLQNGRARGAERASAETIESLRAENEALRAASGQPVPLGTGSDDGDLRASIHALGLAVARMSWAARESQTGDDAREERRRSPQSSVGAV